MQWKTKDIGENMKFYLVILIIALVIPVSQAYSLSAVSIVPSGSLAPGTSVTASFQISISPSFPEGNTLQLTTDLDDANWTWWVFLNGVGSPQLKINGHVLQITSWELTYPKGIAREESVRILLEGTAPQVTATQNKFIFNIVELDPFFERVPNPEIQHISLVVNPSDISNGIASLAGDLQSLRIEIRNKSAMKIDTSKAEKKYHDAQQEINSAQNSSLSRYPNAMAHLASAKTLFLSGLNDLDEAWAQKMVSDAQFAAYSTDQIIGDLKVNRSMGNDTRFITLVGEREKASKLIQNATDAISAGNYEQARIIAIKASEQWNRTFQDAAILKYSVDNFNTFIRLCIIVIIVIGSIVVVVKYRRKKEKEKENPK